MSVVVRHASEADVESIVHLLQEQWPAQGWCTAKYHYYYSDYPEGRPISMLALGDDGAVAHFGVLPIRVSGIRAGLILQVVVSPSHRRGATLVELARASEQEARAEGAQFLCGFANRRFAKVAERLLHWTILGYLSFAEVGAIDLSRYRERYHFEYSDAWFRWKFGREEEAIYLNAYHKEQITHHQLLKTRDFPQIEAGEHGVPAVSLWHPDHNLARESEGWIQPLVLVPLAAELPPGLDDISQWYVEMGDSDTFEPHQPWLQPR